MTRFALHLAVLGMAFGLVGLICRHRAPRTAMLLMGLAALGLGFWAVVSTVELDAVGKAHVISRHYKVFNQSDDPSGGRFSFWFHLGLGTLILLAGVAAVILPFTKRARNLKFPK